MSYSGGLPYDSTPPPEDPPAVPRGGLDGQLEDPLEDALDRPLDEYRARRPDMPEHVKSLMGRMGQGKVYLLEESPGILHVDAGSKIRGNHRIAELAEQLDANDPAAWLEEVTKAAPSPIRHQALFVRSELIKHLSTSKVFSWTTGLGARAMGIEWLNDSTLNLLFPTSSAALLGLSLLAKAGFDPSAGDDPLEERSAHSVPVSLLPQAPLDPSDSLQGTELLFSSTGADYDGVRRKGRGTFSSGSRAFGEQGSGMESRLVPPERENEWNLAPGVDPHARITVRFATEADKKLRTGAKESQWYAKHGRQAGKEVASAPRDLGRRYEGEEVSWEGRGGGEGREFARRIGRERREPNGRRYGKDEREGARERGGRRTAEDLDLELERMARRRAGGENGEEDGMKVDEDVEMGEERRYGARERRGGRSERRGKEDLDQELDDLFAARTAES